MVDLTATVRLPLHNAAETRLDVFPATLWRNGAGVTRSIAAEPAHGAPGEILWSVSVAELTDDAHFSAFPGYDQQFVLVSDTWVALNVGGIRHRLGRGTSLRVPGESAVTVRLGGVPGRALNLMTRRGHADGAVCIVQWAGRIAMANRFTRVVMLLDGAARGVSGIDIPDQGLVLSGGHGLDVECSNATLAVVSVRARPERV